MEYKRVLVIQDISCVGQCSMTVAQPILSACGHETCILPTAILSTHTGGFGKPCVVHLDEYLDGMVEHWKENDIDFDAILIGYLGSTSAIKFARKVLDTMLAPGGIGIVDPAMADHGRLYSGLSEEYAREMKALCRQADIMIPNLTEASMFAGESYSEELKEEQIKSLLEKLNHPCVILTGIGYSKEETGIVLYDQGKYSHVPHERIDRSFHGTGDIFAAAFTGAMLCGKLKTEAVEIAASLVLESIQNTVRAPVHWYGVKFETALGNLIRRVSNEKTAE